jgi:3-oxoacyl-[acyl-carrier-protein] synthase-3
MQGGAGILGVGLYLPPEIRRNDFWPTQVVEKWLADRAASGPPPIPSPLGEGTRRVLQALSKQARDPFHEAVERRVMPDSMTLVDMQEQAARTAIARAGIDPAHIDLVLTNTVSPDFMHGNPACALHERLALRAECLSIETEVATYSVLAQLTLADSLIASGRYRYALLVQSGSPSRLLDMTDWISPIFGDAASALIVGPVSSGRGLLGASHYTDGRYPRTLIASVRDARWFDEGRAVFYNADPVQQHEVFLGIPDICKQSIEAALQRAGQPASSVDFFCMHQGTPWLREVVQEYAGLPQAKSLDLFAETGHLLASNLPATLARAEQEGRLQPGDLVVLMAGGQGMTYGASVLRWGS